MSFPHYKMTQLKVFILHIVLVLGLSSLSKEFKKMHINKWVIFSHIRVEIINSNLTHLIFVLCCALPV